MITTYTYVHRLTVATILLLLLSHVNAGGYHYNPPTPQSTPLHAVINTNSGHYFAPIPTTAPLPPVPSIPPLPKAPARTQPQVQTVVHVHQNPPRQQRPQVGHTASSVQLPANFNTGYNYLRPASPHAPSQAPLIGFQFTPSTASAPSGPPLRIPFGKQPIISYVGDPDDKIYEVNGRQLKQYAVVEFVDNDISQDTKPFLTQSFVNNYRALVGASGTGAIAPLPSSMQLASTANVILLEQQRLAQQGSSAGRRGDTIALGSGGIGFVRLPDGTISLGSGSLNFVTAQQHLEDLRNARTRSELQRDALHFGHGPFEEPSNRFLFK
ncbi:uncharacterized protein [Eurosta solidaginis]|uniref:uncharacterized protein n=1 Tax=Eurosta solidaginis TaxID=178769 RepID=UPI0035314E92